MTSYPTKRRSHCCTCGDRLSKITATGKIRWQPSLVDDKGIYCGTCAAQKNGRRERARKHTGPQS